MRTGMGHVPESPVKRRGRPRVSERGSTVSTWLPTSYHDRLVRIAEAQDVKVSALVRSLLILRLPKP